MKLFYKKTNSKGFTLIELLIAITILIVGLVGVVATIPVARRMIASADLTTRAAIAASKVTEEIKAKGFSTLDSTRSWSGTEDGFGWTCEIVNVVDADFQSAATIPATGLLKLTIEVTYQSRGKTKKETVTTFYSEL